MSEEVIAQTTAETTPAASTEAVVVSGTEPAPQTTPAASEPAQPAATLATADPVEKPVAAPADWPDDWRTKLAGEDKAYLKTLERFGSPADMAKAYRELQTRMARGEIKAGLKPDATPEEIATWRKENGLPATPDEYKPELPNGMVLGDADKPVIEWFKTAAFKANLAPAQFNEVLAEYTQFQDQMRQEAYEKAEALKQQYDDHLRQEWGQEYRGNLRGITNALTPYLPNGVLDRIWGAQWTNEHGVTYQLGNDAEILRGLNMLARDLNPMSSLVPAGSADPMKAGEARISEIEQIMKTDSRAYWTNTELQNEYGKLLEARETARGRAA